MEEIDKMESFYDILSIVNLLIMLIISVVILLLMVII